MKQLDVADQAFIDRRRHLLRWWSPALLSMLALLAGTWCYLYVRHPLMANPSYVVDAVNNGTLSAESLRLSAVMLPVVVGFLFVVTAAMLCYLHLAIRHERRYHALLGRLS